MDITITPRPLKGSITPPPSPPGLRPGEGISGGSAAGGSRSAIHWLLEKSGRERL